MMMVGSLEEAAHDAAIEDGVLSGYGGGRSDDLFKSKKAGLRRGKWTTEEEAYANRLIYEFKLGLLPLTDGTTLRTFLSKLLNCDPMRISKKFVGQNCIGKVNLKLPLFIQFLIIIISSSSSSRYNNIFFFGLIHSKCFVDDNKTWKSCLRNRLSVVERNYQI